MSCYTGLMALIDDTKNESKQAAKQITKQSPTQNVLLVCSDHEEVGSVSAAGAQGSFLRSVLERLCETG